MVLFQDVSPLHSETVGSYLHQLRSRSPKLSVLIMQRHGLWLKPNLSSQIANASTGLREQLKNCVKETTKSDVWFGWSEKDKA